ncbi:MAG: TonB-dependent receptor plug domain-containing protein [Crocinitomicaceae bacterium]
MLFSSAFYAYAQVREQEVEEIHVNAVQQEKMRMSLNTNSLDRKSIQETQPEDVGVLMQKFPGISLKSYGGLGGLKTFSSRGLGAQHTSIVQDGFLLQNAQVGQINLGQVQTSNLEKIQFGAKSGNEILPISALINGSNLSFSTFEGTAFFNATKVRICSKQGSFGQWDEYAAFHLSKERIGLTIHGKFRKAIGNYPYQLKIGNYTYDGIQKNNQLEEVYSGASLFIRPTSFKKPIRIIYRNSFIDQGLPGAIVLYNSYGKQYLNTQQHQISADYHTKWNLTEVRYYGAYQWDKQIYTDSTYLNQFNFLQKTYQQENASAGLSLQKNKFGELIQFYGGLEERYSKLHFGGNDSIQPERLQTFTTAGLKINEKKFLVDIRLSYSLVHENNSQVNSIRNLVSPVVHFELKERGKFNWKMGLFAAITNRLPSFNELFYSQVGNKQLQPEIAQQIRLSNGFSKAHKKWFFTTKIDLYYNSIKNKILTIPTKNLFVWSIQNIGKVSARGLDLVQTFDYSFNSKWKMGVQANYSFQYCLDRTDKSSPSYNHQLAYIPMHSGTGDLSIYRNKTGLRFSGVWVGERYSLNQNISANLLPSFATLDISLFQGFKVKDKHAFQLQFQIKNCFNSSYTYVRSFVMPGRNYLISLSYEL